MFIRHFLKSIPLGLVLATAAMTALADDDHHNGAFWASASGWAFADQEGAGVISEAKGKSTFGKFETSVSAILQTPAGDCLLSSGEPGIAFPVFIRTSITRFGNGDLLYSNSGERPGASFCVSADLVRYELEIEETIVGGTGRFEDATGEWVVSVSGVGLTLAHSSVDALEIDGDIELVHDDEDDDD